MYLNGYAPYIGAFGGLCGCIPQVCSCMIGYHRIRSGSVGVVYIYRIVLVIYSVACIYSAISVVSCFVVLLPDAYVTTFI